MAHRHTNTHHLNKAIFEHGFAKIPNVLNNQQLQFWLNWHGMKNTDRTSTNRKEQTTNQRHLLAYPEIRLLAAYCQSHPKLYTILNDTPRQATQAYFFQKTTTQNWNLGLHQDLMIPVQEKIDHPDLRSWSKKEGIWHVQAPISILEKSIAIRIHLDDCTLNNGALYVIPNSHRQGKIDLDEKTRNALQEHEIPCLTNRGDALLMSPLLLHGSKKAIDGQDRRVLHILYTPTTLGYGLTHYDYHHQ